MFKHRLMLSVAVTALFAVPALATTTITDQKTEEVKTSTANNGAPDDVTVAANGSIVISAAGPALLIDSNNIVDNEGTISNKNKDGAQGVVIDATGTTPPNNGPFSVPAGVTDFFKNNGIIDLTGSGAGKTGVLFKGATSPAIAQVTGDIDLTPSSQLLVTGNNSIGVSFEANTKLVGNLNTLGIITLNQTTVTDTAGSGLIGVNLAGEITGNVNVGGQLTVIGQGGTGLLIRPTGVVDGFFENTGTIFSTGIATPGTKAANPEGGSAVVVNGSILGGFYNAGPTTVGGTETAGTISMAGTGAALVVAPGVGGTADVVLGAIDPAKITDLSNTDHFGFINHGSILAAPVDKNQSGTVVAAQFGGSSTLKTVVTNGMLNTGTISAASNSATGGATASAPTNAVGLELLANAVVPKLVNQSFGSNSGIISGLISGTAGGSAVGILLAQDAIPTGTLEIDNLGGAQISASATTSDSTNTALNAFAIEDLSGKLTKIVNEGTISAVASGLDNSAQQAIAIDSRKNTTGLTLIDGDPARQGNIVGDVLLGSGADTVTVEGLSDTAQSSIFGVLNFGSVVNFNTTHQYDTLTVGDFSTVTSALQSQGGHLSVTVDGASSILAINNVALPTPAPTILHDLFVGPTSELDLTIGEGLGTGVVQALNDSSGTPAFITLASGAKFNLTFGSFIGATNNFVLLDAPNGQLTIPDADQYAQGFATPFLFTGGMCTLNVLPFNGTPTECAPGTSTSTHSQLILTLTPKTVGTGANQLPLTGYAAQLYPIVTQVLPKDNALGAAVVTGVTDNTTAQTVFDSFAPVVNGGSRGLAIAFTDQATGPIGARQRALRTYGKQAGESTLWGVEYAQFLKDPGQNLAGGGVLPGYKDHGFGFSLGGDGGSASDGWYGGALSFYTGDIGELGNRAGQSQTEWYMLSGYTDWRGRGLFLDTNLDGGVTQFKTKRILSIVTSPTTTFSRTATSKHIGVFLAGGVTTGAILKYSGTTITPQISVDGLTMRENGYTESGGGPKTGDAFDLQVGASYTNSLRGFAGVDLRQDIDLGDFFLQPEGRVGYRYDFIGDPQKVTANFVSLPGTSFTIQGPDPSQGNLVAGATIAASTDTWSIGVSYDWVRGSNGAIQQSGQFVLVGRI